MLPVSKEGAITVMAVPFSVMNLFTFTKPTPKFPDTKEVLRKFMCVCVYYQLFVGGLGAEKWNS